MTHAHHIHAWAAWKARGRSNVLYQKAVLPIQFFSMDFCKLDVEKTWLKFALQITFY